MPCCAIRSCRIRRNSLEAKRANISFHIFPKDPEKRLEWVSRINRPGWEPNDATVLCSRHFTTFDFLDTTKGNKLLKGSVPTLHLNDPIDEKTMASKAKERKTRKPKAKYVNVMLQNASKMEDKIPLMDIKVEPSIVGDQPTSDSEIMNQQRTVIADIIKSIMHSLDLLIKSDPDNIRSANVRDKIILALFSYQDIIEEKEVNLTSYKEVDIFDNSNNLKEIDIVYNDIKDDNSEEDFNHFNDGDSHSDFEDQTFLSNLRNKEISLLEKVKVKRKKSSEKRKSVKKLKEKTSKSRKVKKKQLTSKRKAATEATDEGEEMIPEDENDVPHVKTEYSKENLGFESTVPRYVCDICDVTVISEHHLTVHKHLCKRRHYYYGNPLLEEYWNNIKCPLCDVRCTHRGNLGRHYVTHRVKDIEAALASLKEKGLNPENPEGNMKLLNDFIQEFEYKEKVDGDELSLQSGNTIQVHTEGNICKKPSIDDYVKFNLKKIVYDVDINKELFCFPCDIMFQTKQDLEEHRKKINDTDAFVCNHCDKTFDTPTRLIHHAKTHTGLYNEDSLYLHNKLEDTESCPRQMDYKIYACKRCLSMYVREAALRTHITFYGKHYVCYTQKEKPKMKRRRKPPVLPPGTVKTDDGKYHCNQCEKIYTNYYLFLEHVASHSDVSQFRCECGKGFKTKKKLKFHINLVHDKKFDVICEVCGLKVLYSSLRRHRKGHSSLKPFKCAYCNKSFKYKDALKGHIRTHTQEKLWKCQYCGVSFSEKRGYNTHINIHEGKTPYKCSQCPSAFVSKLKLNAHLTEHTDCRNST